MTEHIIVDDEDRENEGDVMIAAEKVTPEAITFMARYACGLICLSLTEERIRALDLPLMVEENTSQYNTAFTVSIEAKHGVTTGISAYDRARTIQVATDDKMIPPDAQRAMSKRARSSVVEIKGSHAVYVSQPRAVAELIAKAASGAALTVR